ncbi:MAG: RnfABCDGE type electron transport complex subunit D [Deltaproteobacteria bacterium]|nr:RnfABCDGE type electron transport complex subunit D [Deltaproteobacteria bacterium]
MNFTVSSSPHLAQGKTTQGIMGDVVIALMPAMAAAVAIFGPRTLVVTAVTIGVAVLTEYMCRSLMKRKQTVSDLSAVVTGLLLAFNLPVDIPLWMAAFGSIFAIMVVKQFFGGIGQNFVNPALAARIVLMASFPGVMSKWAAPLAWKTTAEAVTTASPLSLLPSMLSDAPKALPSLWDMFLGLHAGSMGEVSGLALLLGGLYLVCRKIISPIIPVCFIGTVAVFMLAYSGFDTTFTMYQMLSGGLLLGAIFMATDYATSPLTLKGKAIFAIGCGIITSVIRLFGSLPEGVSFSIILMNLLVPHIERLTAPKPFGWEAAQNGK